MKKVQSREEIKLGVIITKYPADGTSREKYELEPNNHIRYQVHRIMGNEVELKIPDDEVPNVPLVIAGMRVTGIGDNPPVVNKTFDELLNEDIWWINRN